MNHTQSSSGFRRRAFGAALVAAGLVVAGVLCSWAVAQSGGPYPICTLGYFCQGPNCSNNQYQSSCHGQPYWSVKVIYYNSLGCVPNQYPHTCDPSGGGLGPCKLIQLYSGQYCSGSHLDGCDVISTIQECRGT